ncbi:MAG: DNRLRE domain-containing protein [Kiritimatiellaceae bacterium]|nr:DNRLRE domain-containing protein [Kiritimatiellaceae bacterium]
MLGLLLLLQGTETSVYVSPAGSDANNGTAEQPVASVQVGLDKAAALSQRTVTVVLKDGCYRISNPLFFGAQHSGIILKAEHTGNAVISGGPEIAGWQQVSNGLWSATVPAGMDFGQLFINGERKTRARTPNEGWYHGARAYNPAKVTDTNYRENYNRFYFKAGQLDGVPSPSDITNIYMTVFHAWTTSLHAITHVDYTTNLVYLAADTYHPITRFTSDIRFIIENYRAALDAPGEWYLDKSAGKVYYILEEGETITNAVAPAVSNLLLFAGTVGQPVTHVAVKGIVFEHCGWDIPRTNSADGQLGRSMRSYAVHGDYLQEAAITDCVFRHVGADAVWLEDGCRDVLIQKNHFYDIGGSALKAGTMSYPDPVPSAELTQRITVDNNLIHDCGRVFRGGCGIGILNSANNVVSHNEISDQDYTGISVGWGWSTTAGSSSNNLIAYNRIGYIGRNVLSDLAGIYLVNKSPGTVVRNNIIHDVTCYEYGGEGLYADAYGCDMLFESNLVYRAESVGLMRNMGWDNTARNNIFAYCGYLYQSGLAGTNTPSGHTNFYINCNISYCNGTNQFYRAVDATHPVQMDYNLYWNTPTNILFGSNTFTQWKAAGHDVHSRLADPLFVNPLTDDFTLPTNSPAFSLGFQAINYAAAGLYGEAAWTGLVKTLEHTFPVVSVESGYIAADQPDTTYAGATYNGRCLWNGTGTFKRVIYYRFNLPANVPVAISAALKLGITTNCSEGNSYSIVAITNEAAETGWTENTLTWNNAPAHNASSVPSQAWNPAANPNPFVPADTALAASVTVPAGTLSQTAFSIPLNAKGLAMINQDTDHSVTFMVVVNDRSTNAPGFYLSNTAYEDSRPELVLIHRTAL